MPQDENRHGTLRGSVHEISLIAFEKISSWSYKLLKTRNVVLEER